MRDQENKRKKSELCAQSPPRLNHRWIEFELNISGACMCYVNRVENGSRSSQSHHQYTDEKGATHLPNILC